MHVKTLLASLALAATTLAAPLTVGSVVVNNKCDATLYLWDVSSKTSDMSTIKSGGQLVAPYHYDPATGIDIKIASKTDALYTAQPVLILGYTLNNGEGSIYYSLNTVYGYNPLFEGKKVFVHGSKGDVPTIMWDGHADAPSGVKAYFGNTDLVLDLCT